MCLLNPPSSLLPPILVRQKMGLTWDLLGTHLGLNADGIMSVTHNLNHATKVLLFRHMANSCPSTHEQALSRMSGMRNRDSLQSYSSYSLQL